MNAKIMLAVPMHHSPAGKTLQSFQAIRWPATFISEIHYSSGALVYAVRGNLADRALADPAIHYVLFCDADMTPPPHAVESMLSRDADIVAALCCKREPPYRPVILHYWDPQSEGPIEDPSFFPLSGCHPIWGSGLAFTLIKRHVLERVKEKFGRHIFFHEKLANGDPMGEDLTFFWKANQLGFKTVLDADVHVGHLAEYPIYPADAARWFPYSSERMVDEWKRNGERKALLEKIADLEKRLAGPPSLPVENSLALSDLP